MKKFLLLFLLLFFYTTQILTDISLNCFMTAMNTNTEDEKGKFNIKREELIPSQFSAIIEITSPGKVIGRLIGTTDTGNIPGPYVGTMDDSKLIMNHKRRKLDERGHDFILDLISGRFEKNVYVFDKYWWFQNTGTCKVVD